MRSASSCPTRTGPTRACSRSRTRTSSGCRCATTSPRRSPATWPRDCRTEAAQALPALRRRPRVAQREAGTRPLPPVHPVRRRHGGDGQHRRRRRDLHARGRHAWRRWGSRGQYVVKVNNRKVLDGVMASIGIWRRGRTRTSGSQCCAPSTSSIGWGQTASSCCWAEGRKDESGDFTKGAGLKPRAPIDARLLALHLDEFRQSQGPTVTQGRLPHEL